MQDLPRSGKVSIALATYNGERYLNAQLDSYLEQIRPPDELIVTDDCSTDRTRAILADFAARASFPVEVETNPTNLGYVANFSNALARCTGDIVMLSDQDDVWLPEKIETIVRFFDTFPNVQLVVHDLAFCRHDMTPIGQTKIERMRRDHDLQSEYVVGMASAVRGRFLKRCLPVPCVPGVTHDYWLHMCARSLCLKGVIEDVLALHRRHGANATAGKPLNVDYVTSKKHFRARERALRHRLANMVISNDLVLSRSAALLAWLLSTQGDLIADGIVDQPNVDAALSAERARHHVATLRQEIVAGRAPNCIASTYKLYRSGGYAFYQGWKTALVDLVFRCFFRL